MSATVTDGATDCRASPSALRAINARVVDTLETSRSLLGIPAVEDDHLGRVRDGGLFDLLRVVEATTTAVTERLGALSGHSRTVRVLRVQELLAELQSEWHEIQQELLAHQVAMLGGIREALHRLRGSESVSQMVARVTVEVCRSCGVNRCVLLRVHEGKLIPESVHFEREPDSGEEWWSFAREHPPVVDARDPEVQLLRRNLPILVSDPSTSRGISEVAAAAQSTGYVAAPLTVRSNVIGTLHADSAWSGGVVDPVTRDVLAAFAEGFGYALERTVLVERMRSQFSKMRSMMAEANTTLEELFDAGIALRREANGEITTVARGPVIPLPTESRLMGLLTRRELEVVELMARGASNADIANELVISEGTVKSHVKHILRKMRAANRAQAVSCYMRLQSLARA
jgi:DNA-binding CsgD family transcriptional regulator